ncbi:hypothetical protein BD779DRAFT_1668736 [Infundibulicybe gibba]|nr:hypothetical protein BD779DRAFT_1668736 [Infundibulicybe gibba]
MANPSWKTKFKHGVSSFQNSKIEEALGLFNEAIQLGGDNQHIVYDSRAAVYERTGRHKEALRDAKKVIDIAPERWQGYYRSARLFRNLNRYDASIKMAGLALTKIKPDDTKRHDEMKLLQETLTVAQRDAEAHWKRTQCYCKKLPMEMFGEIFSLVVALDSTQLLTILHVCASWRNMLGAAPNSGRSLSLPLGAP